jgi:hypothetical protein
MAEGTGLTPLIEAGVCCGWRPCASSTGHELETQWGAAPYAQGNIRAPCSRVDNDLSHPSAGQAGILCPSPDCGDPGQWGTAPPAWLPTTTARRLGGTAVVDARSGPRSRAVDGDCRPGGRWVGRHRDARHPPLPVPLREFSNVTTVEIQAQLAANAITLVDARGADRLPDRTDRGSGCGHVPGNQSSIHVKPRREPSSCPLRNWLALGKELRLAGARPLVAMRSGVTAATTCWHWVAGHRGAPAPAATVNGLPIRVASPKPTSTAKALPATGRGRFPDLYRYRPGARATGVNPAGHLVAPPTPRPSAR